MPNRINQAMTEEYARRLGNSPDFVAVDYCALSVEEASELRNQARMRSIEVFVVKNSIARRVIGSGVEKNGLDAVITGQTALVFGGEGLPDVARLIGDFKKKTGKLEVRGGVFDRQVIGPAEVERFRSIPDRQTLLAQTLATIIAPLTGLLAATNELLRAPAALAEALAEKQREGSE